MRWDSITKAISFKCHFYMDRINQNLSNLDKTGSNILQILKSCIQLLLCQTECPGTLQLSVIQIVSIIVCSRDKCYSLAKCFDEWSNCCLEHFVENSKLDVRERRRCDVQICKINCLGQNPTQLSNMTLSLLKFSLQVVFSLLERCSDCQDFLVSKNLEF